MNAEAWADSTITSSGVPISIRDFGGDGFGLLLIHGLSRTLVDWSVMAPLLAASHHVVAMDVRGHGRSGDDPWSWRAAVDDVTAVADHCRLGEPAVMGHSLGGMIASMWGREHPSCPGVINLDGHGNPRADQYEGLDPAWVAERRAELDALQTQQLAALSGPLSDTQIDALTAQQKAIATQVGVAEEVFVEGLLRMLDTRDGATYVRPAPDGLGREIYDGLEDVDMFSVYQEVRCPILLLNAVPPPDESGRGVAGPPWISELMNAFRKGQTRDLAALAAAQPNVHLETVVGTHALLFEQSQAIADLVLDFLARRSRGASFERT